MGIAFRHPGRTQQWVVLRHLIGKYTRSVSNLSIKILNILHISSFNKRNTYMIIVYRAYHLYINTNNKYL